MKRSLDQQDGARKELVAQAAVFDDAAQDQAVKDLGDGGFCVIEIMSAKETQQMQESLTVLDEKDPVSCPLLDDIVISYESAAFPPFLHFSNLAIARLAPLFNKFMMPRKNPGDIVYYNTDAGPLLHHRNRAIPGKLPLATTPVSSFYVGQERSQEVPFLTSLFVLVLPIMREEKRTFLRGSHRFRHYSKKIDNALFQTMGGREKMENVSVQPGQALIYDLTTFHRLLEKSKEEPGCLFVSFFFQLGSYSDEEIENVTPYTSNFSAALYLLFRIVSTRDEHWAYDWLKKRLANLKAEGKNYQREELMERNWHEYVEQCETFLFRAGYNVNALPHVFIKISDLAGPEVAEVAKEGKIVYHDS